MNATATERVIIRDCALLVGHMQTGVVVIDGNHVRIRDNVLSVTRKSESLSLERLLEDPRRRRKLVGRLVSKPLLGGVEGGRTRPPIRVGDFVATFDSLISQPEWARLIADNPPTAADTADETTVRTYLAGIADSAIADPSRFPAVDRRIRNLRGLVGATAFDDLVRSDAGRLTIRNLILGGAIDVLPEIAVPGQQRSNLVTRAGTRVRFDSPVPSAAWVAALDSAAVTVNSDEQLKVALYRIGDRVLTNAAFRNQFAAFRAWYQGLIDRNLPSASLGVLCAGRIAEDVTIEGNRMSGVYEGVRVAVSHQAPPGAAVDRAGAVRVVDNTIDLSTPVEEEFGRQGIMIGNVERLRVAGNLLEVPEAAKGAPPYLIGIRVHGHFGSRLLIESNVTFQTSIGIHVRVESSFALHQLWQARDNVATMGTFDIPELVQQTNNIGL